MMVFQKITLAGLLFFSVPGLVSAAEAEPPPVQIDLFFSPGCTECEQVKAEVLPDIEELFSGQYELHQHDITLSQNVPLLLAYQQRCGNRHNGKVSLVVDRALFLSGYSAISTGLVACVSEALVQRQYPGWTIAAAPLLTAAEADAIVQESASALNFSVVAIAGLIDGVNPCAISTLIFFISVLALAKIDRRIRLLVGVSFIFASFMVYTALGLGFIFVLRQAPNFGLVKRVIEVVIGFGMIPLAYLSFRDAVRYRKSARPSDVTLQIPKGIKLRIHSFMNSRMGVGGPILGGLVIGAGVTILESVCTGQGYLPILMYVLKQDCTNLCTWVLLLTYNLHFVLPLIIVFICFHRGMQVTALIAWSKRNLVLTKILLGLFFTAMAVLLLM